MAKLFMEQLEYMTAVTEMLNGSNLPKSSEMEIKVLLIDSGTENIVAKWDDEHGVSDWSVEFVNPEPNEERTNV